MANKPHHGMRGLMAGPAPLKAGAHMPPRVKSGGNRTAPATHTARNGKQTGSLKADGTSDTRRRSGADGNAKGSPPTKLKSPKPSSLAAHKGTAGRGGPGRLGMNDGHKTKQPTALSESPGHAWFESLGAK